MSGWTQPEAIELCRHIEAIAARFGCHVAMTGGCLYGHNGEHKDLDLIFYRIRQVADISKEGLFAALEDKLGIKQVSGFAWCHKATLGDKKLDLLFPEEDGNYPEDLTRRPADALLAAMEVATAHG